jgi:hypothetical protein
MGVINGLSPTKSWRHVATSVFHFFPLKQYFIKDKPRGNTARRPFILPQNIAMTGKIEGEDDLKDTKSLRHRSYPLRTAAIQVVFLAEK